MGRCYCGDIEGKFWFGVQDSNDVENLVTMESCICYSWKVCNCVAEIDDDTYCRECYEDKDAHIADAKENDEYEDECLYYEEQSEGYSLDKITHYEELIGEMMKLKSQIPDEIIESFNKIEQNDKILNAFTGVFNDTHKLVYSIKYQDTESKNEEQQKLSILVARYTLGYQIEYCLRNTESCNIICENY